MQSNTTGVTSGAGTDYPSRAPDLTPVFRSARVQLHVFIFLVPCCDVQDFRVKNDVRFVFMPICFVGVNVLFMLFVLFYTF